MSSVTRVKKETIVSSSRIGWRNAAALAAGMIVIAVLSGEAKAQGGKGGKGGGKQPVNVQVGIQAGLKGGGQAIQEGIGEKVRMLVQQGVRGQELAAQIRMLHGNHGNHGKGK